VFARSRSFFLFEKALIVCNAKGDYYNYKETLLMNEYSVEESLIGTTSGSSGTSSGNLLLDLNNSAGGSSQHSLYLVKPDKCFSIMFKNKVEKKIWKDAMNEAKRRVKPEGQRAQKHFFELTNFDKDIVTCAVCHKHLLGLFYQGYKCALCSTIAHMDCLTIVNVPCSSHLKAPTTATKLPDSVPLPPVTPSSNSSVERSHSSVSSSKSISPPQIARALFKYEGRPQPPDLPPLIFNFGDMIQITDDDDDEWRKGFVMSRHPTSPIVVEGFFPRNYVEIIESPIANRASRDPRLSNHINSLEEFAWFSPVDRETANNILTRLPNEPDKTVFMVRYRVETGGYAISIKYKGVIDHIRINVQKLADLTVTQPSQNNSVFSIDQQHNFNSVQSLVNYYSQHMLKEYFPQLDTTLGLPFRRALPMAVGVSTAKYDYSPSENQINSSEQIELKRGRRYFVLAKEANGWLRLYNSDGLIGYAPSSYFNETNDA
jgi:hypothetical protein